MANQIPNFASSHLTLGAHSNFHTQVANLGTAMDPEALHIAEILARYRDAVRNESRIVNR